MEETLWTTIVRGIMTAAFIGALGLFLYSLSKFDKVLDFINECLDSLWGFVKDIFSWIAERRK